MSNDRTEEPVLFRFTGFLLPACQDERRMGPMSNDRTEEPVLFRFTFVGPDGTMYRIQSTDPSVSIAVLTGEEAEREIQRERSRKAGSA